MKTYNKIKIEFKAKQWKKSNAN